MCVFICVQEYLEYQQWEKSIKDDTENVSD